MSAPDSLPAPTPAAGDSLWLALHFAQLALDVFALRDDTRAIAVVAQRRVHCANRDNLPPGLAIATAHALHADLLALERRPERECAALQQLAHWAYRFTPGVVIAEGNTLLLEIGSCRRLYRGARNLLRNLGQALQQRQQRARFGLARTPRAAWLLAQCACPPALAGERVNDDLLREQLAAIPVAALAVDAETQRALMQMGLATLGALNGLPAAALGKRFGAGFIDYLGKVHGTRPDPQRFFTPAPQFHHGFTFIDAVAQRQMLLFPMKRLLQMLDDYLRARQLHAHTLHWQLFDAQRVQARLSLELSRAQYRWHDLLELSRLKLDRVEIADSVFGIDLGCGDFFEAIPAPSQLFPDAGARRDAAAALRDRLRTRLGAEALQTIAVQEAHWPEHAWRYDGAVPAQGHAGASMHAADAPPARDECPRPALLLPQPQRLPQRDDRPCWPTPLELLRGPERIGNHWWQEDSGERDYYIARNARGMHCWIYRDRATRHWFLHGLFA